MDGLRSLLVYPRIVLQGRPFAPMPRQILHGHDVCLPLEEMRHECLPEDMVSDLLFNAELRRYTEDQPMDALPRAAAPEPLPAGDEEGRTIVVTPVKIPLKPIQAALGEVDLLRRFRLHVDNNRLLVLPINVFLIH